MQFKRVFQTIWFMSSRIGFAGHPAATQFAGNERVTTEPAPTTVLSPMVTPFKTVTFSPSQTLLPISIGAVLRRSR